ncbi:unnamed protein product [Rhodiola kirilowii]
MSLALIEGYSSAEEEDENDHLRYHNSSDEDDEPGGGGLGSRRYIDKNSSVFDFSKNPPAGSALPSAFDVFSEITGPPQFLNNAVGEETAAKDEEQQRERHGKRRHNRDKRDLPAGAVLESKPQLVEIRDRVRSDVGGTLAAPSAQHQKGPVSPIKSEGKRVATAANPNPEDAADLLRMCLQCGIPKTFTTGKGMVCPVCNDRPPADPNKEAEKKKGSTIKDKEKNKRMKGQSSHASWKSETEMQLRQQFD